MQLVFFIKGDKTPDRRYWGIGIVPLVGDYVRIPGRSDKIFRVINRAFTQDDVQIIVEEATEAEVYGLDTSL